MPAPRKPEPPPLRAADDARVAARAILAHHCAVFAREEDAARAGAVEGVHQLRVATRRIRATLRLFAPVLPPRGTDTLVAGMAGLGQAIGAVRDLDVLDAAVVARGAGLDAPERQALAPLRSTIAVRRADAHAALLRTLAAPATRRVLERLARLAAARPAARGALPLGGVAATLLRPLVRAVDRAGRDVDADAPPEALHRLRVRVKALRYACEALAGLAPADAARVIGRLATLQDLLGEQQDAVTQAAWLRAAAATGEAGLPPATLLAVGALLERLARRARRRRARALRAWARVERPRIRRALAALVRHADGTTRRDATERAA